MQLARAVGEALADLGVDHVFGVVGSGNFIVTNALSQRGARFVAARHETSAVAMADGFARVSRGVGVASVHQGPGFTNAITGLVEAAKARSPVLMLAADTPAGWAHSNFKIDQFGVASAAGIGVERVGSADTAAADLGRAWRRAAVDRRATVLLLPLDVQGAEVDALDRHPSDPGPMPSVPPAAAVAQLADIVARAERPVIIAGRGAVLARARDPLERLGDAIGAVMATSLVANGLFRGNRWDLGISGGFATPLAAELIAASDLVIAFGATLNRWTTRHGKLIAPEANVVQVDSDAAVLGAQLPVDLGIVADACETAVALLGELERRGHTPAGQRTDALATVIAEGTWRQQPFQPASSDGAVDPRSVTIALQDLLPAERTVTVDGGHFSGWPAMYLEVPDADSFVFNQSFQSIGLGLGAAIGAAMARPDRLSVAAVGDGGLFMALGELETAARLHVPMIVLAYNDDAYGAEVHHFEPEGHDVGITRFGPTDLAAIGRAVGADGITVRGVDDLGGVEGWLRGARAAPLVVDLKVNPAVVGAWLPEAFRA